MSPVFDPAVFDSSVFDTGGGGAWAANISMALTLTGNLQLTAEFVANIPMTMGVTGGLTALITLAANIPMVMNMEAPLRTARMTGILLGCGHPLAADCDSWLLSIFQREDT
jgi:hypothetical protein